MTGLLSSSPTAKIFLLREQDTHAVEILIDAVGFMGIEIDATLSFIGRVSSRIRKDWMQAIRP